ncbi:MAG: acetoacetate decarboxylase family protein [Jiangellales bacterium]
MYTLTKHEVQHLSATQPFMPQFPDAEVLSVVFRTDPAFIADVVPRPLRPAAEPLAQAFVSRYPRTNFGVAYNEAAVFVPVSHKGETGAYCLTMPVDDDVAMIGGREQFGFPKKIAEITLDRDGDTVIGRVVRKGSEILTLEAELTDPADLDQNRPPAMRPRTTDLDGQPCYPMTCFLFKAFLSPDARRFDYLPRLVREVVLMRPSNDLRTGAGKIAFHSSAQDPLGDIPVRDVIGVTYGTWSNTMLPAKVVGRSLNLPDYQRHTMTREDVWAYLLDHAPTHDRRKRRRTWKAIRKY